MSRPRHRRQWRTRLEKNQAIARRMWRVLRNTGGWQSWSWPRQWMHDAMERSTQ
jgi:hypothetical protein